MWTEESLPSPWRVSFYLLYKYMNLLLKLYETIRRVRNRFYASLFQYLLVIIYKKLHKSFTVFDDNILTHKSNYKVYTLCVYRQTQL